MSGLHGLYRTGIAGWQARPVTTIRCVGPGNPPTNINAYTTNGEVMLSQQHAACRSSRTPSRIRTGVLLTENQASKAN